MTTRAAMWVFLAALIGLPACGGGGDRDDGAYLLSEDPRSLQNPCVSPDGDRAVVTAFHDGYGQGAADLVMVDLETGALEDLVADGARNVNHPGHCWNGSNLVVFASDVAGDGFDLHSLDPDSGDVSRITDLPDRDATQATWTGDGAWIAFLSEDASGAVVTLVQPDGSSETPLTDPADVVTHPTASPTDDRVAYQRLVDGVWNLELVDPGSTTPEELTDASGDDVEPSWTWDGSRVVFTSDRDGQAEPDLYAVAIEGCEVSQMLANDLFEGAPALTSDDGFVLFETADATGDATDLWYIPSPGG
jgi:TolB protein